jgi:hypothetical protein
MILVWLYLVCLGSAAFAPLWAAIIFFDRTMPIFTRAKIWYQKSLAVALFVTLPTGLLILTFGPFMTWVGIAECITTAIVSFINGYKLLALDNTPLRSSNREHRFIFWGIMFLVILSVFISAPLLFGASMPYGGGFFGGEYPISGTMNSFLFLSLPVFIPLIIQIFLSISETPTLRDEPQNRHDSDLLA